jgi:hypothetical protein
MNPEFRDTQDAIHQAGLVSLNKLCQSPLVALFDFCFFALKTERLRFFDQVIRLYKSLCPLPLSKNDTLLTDLRIQLPGVHYDGHKDYGLRGTALESVL